VASATGAQRVHGEALALIEDPSVEAILIASPDPTHEELVLACLAAGKPVLCEKPLAPDIEGCLRIVAAETAMERRLVQVGFMRRFDPGYGAMQSALRAGRIGAPLLMHCVHRNASAPPSFDSSMLISNSAVHEIDIARWLLEDEFASVTVFRRTPPASDSLVDPQFLVLESRKGVIVDIEVFVNARYGYDVRAELVGEAGSLTLVPQPSVRIRSSGQDASSFAEDWRAHFAAAYKAQLQAWVDSLRTGIPVGASAWDGYAATATAAACLMALQSGQRSEVSLQPRPQLYART
jgi:myo-inositol 2-dehydrogenase/D-chiro-inositol 1-dehydrogenase